MAGDVLYRAEDYDFVVVLEGLAAVVEGYGDEEREIGVHGPRRFLGELSSTLSPPSDRRATRQRPRSRPGRVRGRRRGRAG
jgi:hypothetical protein